MRNNPVSLILCVIVAAARVAHGQDLFEKYEEAAMKGKDKAPPKLTADRSRMDLHLAPDFVPFVPSETSGSSKLGVKADFDYDFACGNFDIRAGFQHLLTKEVGEETLQTVMGMLQAQLAKSSMVFLCETSPTLCQALQHYRISANALLKLNYDRCAAIEEAVDTVEKNLYTSALKECMQEQQKQGKSIDQALDACRKMDKVRNLLGGRVAEVDLTKEVADALGLSKEVRDVLGILGGDTKYSAKGLETKIDSKAVERRFLAHRETFTQAWKKAIQGILEEREVSEEDLLALSPDRSRPVALEELVNITLLDEREREILIASIASLAAKVKLDGEIREAERAYQVVAMTPTADKKDVDALEKRVEWLRKERQRLEDAYRSQRELNEALLAVRAVGQAEMLKRVRSRYAGIKLRVAEKQLISDTRPFGSRTNAVSTTGARPGDSCAPNCGGGDWSWGKP